MIHLSDELNNPGEAEAEVASIPLEAIPEKFRGNPAAVFESYANLEREFHASKQQSKAMEENFSTLSQQLEELTTAQSTPQADPNDVRARLEEMYESDPLQTMATLTQQILDARLAGIEEKIGQQYLPTQQTAHEVVAFQADQLLTAELPDWGAYKGKVAETINDNRWLLPTDALTSPNTTAERLKAVYKMVKHDELSTQLTDPAAIQAAAAQLAKEQAQTISGVQGRPSTPDEFEQRWKQIQNADTTNARSILGG